MKIIAIISIRNNKEYLSTLLNYLSNQKIQVVLIDQASNDGSESIYKHYKGNTIIDIIDETFDGTFSLKRQLQLKEQIRKSLDAEWIIHHDSDEIMQSNVKGESLYEMISRVDSLGYNTINLDEFVFVPKNKNVDYSSLNYIKKMKYYYHFAPAPLRLNRIFKTHSSSNSVDSGGHQMAGEDIRIFPHNMILRHYIGLSWQMLVDKYKNRKFSDEEVAIGWHLNRININWDILDPPSISSLMYEPQNGINTSQPFSKHFWQWKDEEE